ncbi:transposase [Staphylococcus sp. EZ-P03]|uniref:transposase n=1 Tax=Staphylococcus sp. EZ-P03 TaxID=2282739 RepID=UPI0013C44664|nr:transposase [Staphylococcus sp. EZ-P03]
MGLVTLNYRGNCAFCVSKKGGKFYLPTIKDEEPLLLLFKELFPNASIIFDRFHIVQHMNRELNFYRREVMNRYREKGGSEYPVSKNKWRLLLTDKRKIFMMDSVWDGSFRCYKKAYDLVNFMLQTDGQIKNSYKLIHDLRESLKLYN